MSNIILKVENVSKQYQLGTYGTKTIGGDVHRWWTTQVLGKEDPFLKVSKVNDRTSKEKTGFVWALKDINFDVQKGEVLGIIGKNGAGKSTLLKLLSRVTLPTTGKIKSAGRMASLLEVGTGFHPELTGLENIYLNGAILGMTKSEIKRKLDEIIDFSGCALYIDTPVKRYSSGMKVRLGFAVAAFLDPEILVVDEVLAVGDAEFQKKAIGKMKDVSNTEGRTVLFVSHDLNAVRNLCESTMIIENGGIFKMGQTSDMISCYRILCSDVTLKNSEKIISVTIGDGRNDILELWKDWVIEVDFSEIKSKISAFQLDFGLDPHNILFSINSRDLLYEDLNENNKIKIKISKIGIPIGIFNLYISMKDIIGNFILKKTFVKQVEVVSEKKLEIQYKNIHVNAILI
jgi:ABC-type polysaccharide/polyol phosphate transport system ATPase subunit